MCPDRGQSDCQDPGAGGPGVPKGEHGLGVGGECQQTRRPEMQGQIMQRL